MMTAANGGAPPTGLRIHVDEDEMHHIGSVFSWDRVVKNRPSQPPLNCDIREPGW